jgi:hypothetical protein
MALGPKIFMGSFHVFRLKPSSAALGSCHVRTGSRFSRERPRSVAVRYAWPDTGLGADLLALRWV